MSTARIVKITHPNFTASSRKKGYKETVTSGTDQPGRDEIKTP
jgi:hypothetical protein